MYEVSPQEAVPGGGEEHSHTSHVPITSGFIASLVLPCLIRETAITAAPLSGGSHAD